MKNSYTKFSKDAEKYMTDKLPNIDPATATEIGAYLSNRTSILIQDMMNDYAKELKKSLLPKIPAYRPRNRTEGDKQLLEKAYKELTDCKFQDSPVVTATEDLRKYLED